ncbi:hypothetical protein N665_0064s0068 [Sinapis alba]|nr:hypothetical protein N665_0064s0068 [Sinapis alba]
MRYSIMFMVSACVLTFLVLNGGKVEVEAMKKLGCKISRKFPGTCGTNGKSTCVNDYRKRKFPNNRGINCDCADIIRGSNRFRNCTCQHDC